jgi:predicted nucleic acid-binding protein
MNKDKVFLDTDVILDLLTRREPHFEPAVELFLEIQNKAIQAYTSPVVIANLFYILHRHFDRKKAIQSLMKIRTLVGVLNCGVHVIDSALLSDFTDFEDAVQYYTALENSIDIIITRNIKDYKTATITVTTPLEYMRSR